jgi:DNA-binding MarR family transcriptional regulator
LEQEQRSYRFGDVPRAQLREISPEFDLEATAVVFNLIRAANRIVQDLEAVAHRPAGLSWAGFRILFTVHTMGPTEPQQLARFSGVTRASISSVLNTLERDGLIARTRGSADKRVVTVSLTERGDVVVREAMRRQNARERAWVTCLDHEERKTLANLLLRLVEHHPKDQP